MFNNVVFFPISSYAFYENVEKCRKTVQGTVDNIKCRMRIACWITKDRDTL